MTAIKGFLRLGIFSKYDPCELDGVERLQKSPFKFPNQTFWKME